MEKNKTRKQHYEYAHGILREFFLNIVNESFFTEWTKYKRNLFFVELWDSVQTSDSNERNNTNIYETEIDSSIEILGEHRYLTIVKLPEPVGIPEAYYICGYNRFADSNDSFDDLAIENRYFTLEYDDDQRVCFCEWTKEVHLLHDFTKDKSLKGFVCSVKEAIGV